MFFDFSKIHSRIGSLPIGERVGRGLDSILDFFFPRKCPVCGNRLELDEHPLCLKCNVGMPRTMFWEHPYDNPMARMYWGKIPVEKVAAYFYFAPKSGVAQLIYGVKYHGRANIAIELGEMLADEMQDFFDDIDCIVPLPISIKRRMKRGYNQSDMIARGVSKATGIPIESHAVIRRYFETSQTHLTRIERRENVDDVFVLKDADALHGKHVLIVDDVITTGATTISCAEQILKAGNVKVSILSLGYSAKQKAQEPHEPMLF